MTIRKFPDSAYDAIDPAYELLDDGSVRHRETLVVRPKFYSRLPIPFKVGDRVKVVPQNLAHRRYGLRASRLRWWQTHLLGKA